MYTNRTAYLLQRFYTGKSKIIEVGKSLLVTIMKKYLYGVRDSSTARLSQRLILGG
jgi:hypothetical protein